MFPRTAPCGLSLSIAILASVAVISALAAEQAPILEGRDVAAAKFDRGVWLFSDRNYTRPSVPTAFEGMAFLDIGGAL